MAKNLVIVESPGKVKAIGKYLGKDYLVKASLGHVKDLPKKDLSVDVDNDFKPVYEVIEGKRKLIAELKAAAKGAENIYLAADPDREGEAICFHLQEELETKKTKIFRVMFNEITKSAVQKAFEKPLSVNLHLVDAQQARRVLDRLVGYKISPLLWDKVRRGLSAGRVQTVALRLIVERENEIKAFIPREYWSIDVNLGAKLPPQLRAHLAKKNEENLEIGDEATATAIVNAVDGAAYSVRSVTNREKRRNAAAPFITSTLQQEGARKLRFSVKRSMILAQKLYEGVELSPDEGAVGLITYMRTDSTRVSNDALDEVRAMIKDRYGADYVPGSPNTYKSKKDAQDAHEAIRPTSVLRTPESVASFLGEDELKLYRLIWMRFVASQMAPAVFDQTSIDIDAKGKDGASYIFRATGSVEKFDGFLKVYEEGKDSKDDPDDEAKTLPAVEQGEVLEFRSIEPEQHFTEPPPRFTEATLVKELEADGVGRPSTYASILSTIQEREYVRKDGGKFFPTELGTVVAELLLESFNDLFDVTYTARMEAELDEIEEGKLDWRMAMSDFYERFSKDLDHAATHMTDVKRMEVPTDFKCEKCGKPMVIKWGRHGKFIACTGYPDFSPKSAEGDFEAIRKEIGKQHERAQKETGKREEREARYNIELEKLNLQIAGKKLTDRKVAEQRKKIKARLDADLEKIETKRLEQQAKDQSRIKGRLKVLQTRYPGLAQFYHLDLGDMATFGQRNEHFCTYSREIPSDAQEPDESNLEEAVMCDNCGRPMVLKKGRFGQFLACSAYPDCKTTKQLGAAPQQQDVTLDEKCPNCSSNMVRKYGRFGEFVACSNYPACKYVKQKTIGVKCPNCSEGEVVERRSKRGKTFYGCNRYPDCDFVAWGKPIAEKCPECSGAYLIEKYLKAGPMAQCPNAECKFKKPLPPPEEAPKVDEPVEAQA